MKKNKIIVVISIVLIASTLLLTSSAFSISLSSTKDLATRSSPQTDEPFVIYEDKKAPPIETEGDPGRAGGFGLIGDTLVSTYEWQSTKATQTQALILPDCIQQ
jgi:hypothetical protein